MAKLDEINKHDERRYTHYIPTRQNICEFYTISNTQYAKNEIICNATRLNSNVDQVVNAELKLRG